MLHGYRPRIPLVCAIAAGITFMQTASGAPMAMLTWEEDITQFANMFSAETSDAKAASPIASAPRPAARPIRRKVTPSAPRPRPKARPRPSVERVDAPIRKKAVAPRPKPQPRREEPRATKPARQAPRTAPKVRETPDEIEPADEGLEPIENPDLQAAPPLALDPLDSQTTLSGKEVSGKEINIPALDPEKSSPWTFGASSQWSSKFYFRGLNVLERISPDEAPDGITSSRLTLDYADPFAGRWQLGAGYIEALDAQLTNANARQVGPNLLNSKGRKDARLSRFDDHRVGSKERYSEADFWLNYSRPIVGDLSGMVGLSHYQFSDAGFWDTDATSELNLGLSYSGLKHVDLGLNYTWDFDAFDGSYVELNARAKGLPELYKNGYTSVRLVPRARLAYDLEYNGDNSGWNHAEVGLDMPIQLTRNISLLLAASYAKDLGDSLRDGTDRTDDGFWFSAMVNVGDLLALKGSQAESTAYASGKGKVPVLPEAATPKSGWRFSGGAGWRSLDASITTSRVPFLTSALGLFDRSADEGDVGLATGSRDANYADGSVRTAGRRDGTGSRSGGSVLPGTSFQERNQQVLFTSQTYSTGETGERFSFQDQDSDGRISPYLRLDYDFIRRERSSVSAGLAYMYTGAELDTGTRLAAVQTGLERSTTHLFLYDANELAGDVNASNGSLIVDANAFANSQGTGTSEEVRAFLRSRTPQQGSQTLESTRSRIATFVSTGLDVGLHSISVPLTFSWEVNDKLRLSLSAGPTLNILNYDLTTVVDARQVSNFGKGREVSNDTNFQGRGGLRASNDFTEGNTFGGKEGNGSNPTLTTSGALRSGQFARGTSVAPRVATGAASAASGVVAGSAGGKGADVDSPVLPGKSVARRTYRDSGSELLLGATAQATATWDLDATDTWYLELWGRYDYMSSFTISNSVSSAEVDASSWSLGAGLGYRF